MKCNKCGLSDEPGTFVTNTTNGKTLWYCCDCTPSTKPSEDKMALISLLNDISVLLDKFETLHNNEKPISCKILFEEFKYIWNGEKFEYYPK